jgi:hypothetical protein
LRRDVNLDPVEEVDHVNREPVFEGLVGRLFHNLNKKLDKIDAGNDATSICGQKKIFAEKNICGKKIICGQKKIICGQKKLFAHKKIICV